MIEPICLLQWSEKGGCVWVGGGGEVDPGLVQSVYPIRLCIKHLYRPVIPLFFVWNLQEVVKLPPHLTPPPCLYGIKWGL